MSKLLVFFLHTKNAPKNTILVKVFWANCSFTHFSWATWANCSWLLIFGEQPERFAHMAHFWWATWAMRSHRSLKKREWANCSCLFYYKKRLKNTILVKVFWAMSKWANSQLLFERSEWMSKWALSEFSALNFLQVGVRPTGPGAGHWGCWGSHPCPCPGGQDLCGGGLLDQWLHSTGACLLYIQYSTIIFIIYVTVHWFQMWMYCTWISFYLWKI